MAVSPDTLAAQLAEAGLVPQAELAALREQHQPADAEALARLLVKLKVLTAYQAQQAYAGKSKALVLGNYVILDKLGQGGMGMVLKARHRRMNRIVALKVLSPAVTRTPDAMKRFQREVEAAAKLHHPHIVTAHDADEVNGTHFLVMEYVEGTDLSVLVKKKGPLPVDQVINCMLQAARGLEYAHRHGVIHRDIKPANLLLDKEGTIKVLDMGLARIEGETGANAELTSTGAVMGTVDYMAPEQALSTKSADARSDIYSLGISLWYLLIGRPVFEGDSLMARLIAHRETPPPSLKGARGEVPAALDALFQKMIAKKPGDRCQSMTEVIAALETCHLPQAPEAKSTPSFTTGPSEESKLSEFIGLFGGGTDPNAATRTVPNLPQSATLATPTSGSEYEATVTSVQSAERTEHVTQAARPPSRRQAKVSNVGRKPKQIAGGVAALALLLGAWLFWPPRSGAPIRSPGPLSSSGDPRTDSPPEPDGSATPGGQQGGSCIEVSGAYPAITVESLKLGVQQPFTLEAMILPTLAEYEQMPGILGVNYQSGLFVRDRRVWDFSSILEDGSSPSVAAGKLEKGRPVHLAAVFDGGEQRLYIDGQLSGRTLLSGGRLASPMQPFSIGSAFFGRLDEIRVSRVARYTENFAVSQRHLPDQDTTALFHCDEGQGSVLKDSSGNNHDGSFVDAQWVRGDIRSVAPSSEPGAVVSIPSKGQGSTAVATSGLELDGIDDYIDLTSDWAYDGGPVTVELWTTPGVPALAEACTTLLHSETPSNPLDHPLKFCYLNPSSQVANDGELHLDRPPDHNVAAATHQFRPGVRTHLAAVFDGKESTFFVDGRPLPRKIFIYSWPKHEGERFTWIGAARSSENGQTALSQFWTGIVHNCRISSSARYTSEFKPPAEFRVDPATEGLYLFEEGAGSVAKDSSGHERHGKIVGGRWAAPGQPPADGPIDPSPGSSLRFDGATAFVEVPSLRLDGARPLTLEAWMLADYERDIEKNCAIMGWNGGAFLCRGSAYPWYSLFAFGREGEEAKGAIGVPRESRQMHHIAGVWDGSTLRTFLDGKPGEVRQVDQLFRALRDNDALKENFCIGASIFYGTGANREKGEFFKGFIDEVRVSQSARYSGEFTPEKRFEPDADTLALFHFDEGNGTEVRDTSGNGHHGKVVGAKWFKAKTSATAKMASTDTAPPTPAIAPFSAEQARIHQDASAAHLQVPVETTNSIGMKFRLIPSGEYERGQGEGEAAAALAAAARDRNWQERIRGEAPRHRVRLTQPFFLGTTEVTQGQFLEVTGRNPSYFSSNGPGKEDLDGGDSQSLPVENVSWRDVADFCERLSRREGLAVFDFENSAQPQPGAGYQLPSEAQWEFACRAGTTTRYGCGDSDEKLSSVAWFSANSEERTHPVGQLAANNFGLFDLHGNVWELTTDSWDVWAYEAFKSSVAVDPRGPSPPGAERVVRGGDRLDPSVACRSAHRGATRIGGTDPRIGFRVLLSVEAVKALSGAPVPAK